jgi:hypothetical protein
MANRVILKNKETASSAPTVHATDPDGNDDLMKGELALNNRDGKLYFAKTTDGINYTAGYFGDSTQSPTSAVVSQEAVAMAIALG